MKKLNISRKFLINEYIENKNSREQIAKDIECSSSTIRSYLIKYKIKLRSRKEANLLGAKKRRTFKDENNPGYIDGRRNKKHYCIEPGCNNEISYVNWKYGNRRCKSCENKRRWKDNKFRTKIIKKGIERWQSEEYKDKAIKSIIKGLKLKPNKPEKLLNKLLSKILHSEYKFVGDGKVIIGGFNPDFININGQKKIIEHYGDYFHNLPKRKKSDKKRLSTYKKYGYKTLIIWEHELKNLKSIRNKILEFNNV